MASAADILTRARNGFDAVARTSNRDATLAAALVYARDMPDMIDALAKAQARIGELESNR